LNLRPGILIGEFWILPEPCSTRCLLCINMTCDELETARANHGSGTRWNPNVHLHIVRQIWLQPMHRVALCACGRTRIRQIPSLFLQILSDNLIEMNLSPSFLSLILFCHHAHNHHADISMSMSSISIVSPTNYLPRFE